MNLQFFRQLKEELKSITWTSSSKLTAHTQVILLFIVVFSGGIYLTDMLIKALLIAVRNLLV